MSAKKNESWLNQFIGRRSISKTLQFELRPIGKTLENIKNGELLEKDEQRSKEFDELKKLIDNYHKEFIDQALTSSQIDWSNLGSAYKKGKDATDEEDPFEKAAEEYRKKISEIFSKGPYKETYNNLFRKELITKVLPDFAKKSGTETQKKLLEKYKRFTTYLRGFQENRKNIYTDEKESTAIGYRLIHENFPKFMFNLGVYAKIKEVAPSIVNQVTSNLSEKLTANHIASLDEIFELNFFNRILSQKGIDFYNLIVSGIAGKAGMEQIPGLNVLINLYNQQQKDIKDKLPRFVALYKQILSDRDSYSFRPEPFENDAELIEALENFCNSLRIGKSESHLRSLTEILGALENYDESKLKLKKNDVDAISQELFKSWNKLMGIRQDVCGTAKEKTACAKKKYFTVKELNDAIRSRKTLLQEPDEKDLKVNDLFDFWKMETDQSEIEVGYKTLKDVLAEQKGPLDEKDIEKIKEFLDKTNNFFHKVDTLSNSEDEKFLGEIEESYDRLREIIPLYNKVRNYVTRKPSDKLEKFKLTFGSPQLAEGWDKNKEQDYCSVLFVKENNFYLGIINPANKVKFDKVPKTTNKGNVWQKVNYKYVPDPFKMLPKVFLPKKSDPYNAPKHIREIRENQTYKTNLSDMRELVDFYKNNIPNNEDWNVFGFKFSETEVYNSINDFYKEVEDQGYNISFDPIAENDLIKLVDENKLFLFQIYSKDFSPNSKGTPNLHTLYWRMVFDPKNLKDIVIRLCGKSELFYRKGDDQKVYTHKAGSILVNRQTSDGVTIPPQVYKELFNHFNHKNKNESPLSQEAKKYIPRTVTKVAAYDIIKDRRFTKPMFKFHVPLQINFKSPDRDPTTNEDVLHALRAPQQKFTVLGIDRGERNLIYITLIDQDGKILLQKSMNQIEYKRADGVTNRYDYQVKLDQREKERGNSQKSWKEIGTIKELKEGYISQIVHEIAKIVTEYNAIIVMEDLNSGFKRGRFHVEKQIYQKFEKALLDKFNYLVFKDRNVLEPGGVLKGYQLTAKFESFRKLQNQTGIIFYVPAAYTSKIDPTTGFTNPLYGLHYESVEKAGKRIQEEIQSIRFNKREDHFEFVIPDRREKGKTPVTWTVCTAGNLRWSGHRNTATGKWDIEARDVTKELKALFKKHGISFESGEELKEPVLGQDKKEFFNTLFYLLNLTLQLRYSNPDPEIEEQNRDFILSPVRNRAGKFFDSRTADESLPKDADANGAYHIALKGLFHIESGKSKIEKKGFDQRWLEERRQNLK